LIELYYKKKGFGDSSVERAEGQTAEAALPGRLHLTFLRHHGTLEPRFGLGLPGTRIRLEEILFHLQSKEQCNSFLNQFDFLFGLMATSKEKLT
jgi:hypothetical protein